MTATGWPWPLNRVGHVTQVTTTVFVCIIERKIGSSKIAHLLEGGRYIMVRQHCSLQNVYGCHDTVYTQNDKL